MYFYCYMYGCLPEDICVLMCTTCMLGAHRHQKRALDLLELELGIVVTCPGTHVGAEKPILGSQQEQWLSHLLSHLSSPNRLFFNSKLMDILRWSLIGIINSSISILSQRFLYTYKLISFRYTDISKATSWVCHRLQIFNIIIYYQVIVQNTSTFLQIGRKTNKMKKNHMAP